MCEGSFLPSSFGPHQKHTEFESSLRSYPINPFALFAKGWGLFSRSRTESAFTHLSFRGAPRREPAFKYLSFRIRFSGEESAFCPGAHPFAFFAKRRGLFPSHVGAGALTRPGGDFFRAAEQNLLSHTCHSEERRDEESAVVRHSNDRRGCPRSRCGCPILSRFLRKGGDFFIDRTDR